MMTDHWLLVDANGDVVSEIRTLADGRLEETRYVERPDARAGTPGDSDATIEVLTPSGGNSLPVSNGAGRRIRLQFAADNPDMARIQAASARHQPVHLGFGGLPDGYYRVESVEELPGTSRFNVTILAVPTAG